MRFKSLYFLLSAIFIIPGVISLLLFGLKPGIDFSGGTLIEIKTDPREDTVITDQKIKDILQSEIDIYSVQSSGNNQFLIRAKPVTSNKNETIKTHLDKNIGAVDIVRFETVGPILGKELLRKTVIAIVLAATAILFYVAYRFNELKYGVCAILAMFHDTLVVLGTFSLLGHFHGVEVDTLFVTAVLTILSFSVHDTIVVYDRIRETIKRHPRENFITVVNQSVAETLGRSVNNSMTIIFMLLALYLLGGQTIKWFVFALLIGTITGTYSSTFTAAPLLVVWNNKFSQKK